MATAATLSRALPRHRADDDRCGDFVKGNRANHASPAARAVRPALARSTREHGCRDSDGVQVTAQLETADAVRLDGRPCMTA
jgi:hypothetical protein